MLEPPGYKLDWIAFADAWRAEYQPSMEEVRAGRIPFSRLDVIHRRMLDRIRPRFGLVNLDEAVQRELNLAWHKLDAWPGVSEGLKRLSSRYLLAPCSTGNIALMVISPGATGFRGMRSSAPRSPGTTSRSWWSTRPRRSPSASNTTNA